MRSSFFILITLLLTGSGYPPVTTMLPPPGRPNIVIVMADDMGFSDIGCYGGEIATPNIDRLAAEGIRFTRMYNNAWCSPSRASLLTGLYPQQVGMGVLAGPHPGPEGPYQGFLSDSCVTIAEVLRQAGYATAMSGKWHLGEFRPHWPVDRGFDHYFGLISGAANYFDITKAKSQKTIRYMALDGHPYTPPKEGFYMTDAITDDALKTLDNFKDPDQPLFLYVAYTAPHWPLQALPGDIKKYKGHYDKGWDAVRKERFDRQLHSGILNPGTQLSPRDREVQPWEGLSQKRKKEMAAKMEVYAAQIDRMDQGIGRILEKINSSGKKENTIVIFLSDNGGCAEKGLWGFDKRKNGLPPGGVDSYMSYGQSWANASNTPFRFFKKWLHEGGVATPMIIRWPAGISKGREGSIVSQVGHVIDMMPTLCEIGDANYPREFHGKRIPALPGQSLVPEIKWGKEVPHKPIYWSLNGHKALLMGNYKLESLGEDAPWELYDLKKDRTELKDLSAGHSQTVTQMAALWKHWADSVGVYRGRPEEAGE